MSYPYGISVTPLRGSVQLWKCWKQNSLCVLDFTSPLLPQKFSATRRLFAVSGLKSLISTAHVTTVRLFKYSVTVEVTSALEESIAKTST